MNSEIDFVIIWVDGDDAEWIAQKNKYLPEDKRVAKSNLYRDWDNLQYWFRGIEKFTPWVNRVHFVTCGHLPSWLNVNHPKLNIVKHSDYIPNEYLPTFNSHCIELNLHRIKGLSERFVYFNDDMFVIDSMKPEEFFYNNLPCDSSIMSALAPSEKNDMFYHILANNLAVVNSNFEKSSVIKRNIKQWLNLKYGKLNLKNLYYLPIGKFTGFQNFHLPSSFLKSTFVEMWEKEHEILDKTSCNKFRTVNDVNQYIFSYWQMMNGKFNPRRSTIGKFFSISNDNMRLYNAISNQTYKMVCINDTADEINFELEKEKIKKYFEYILPEKSEFER